MICRAHQTQTDEKCISTATQVARLNCYSHISTYIFYVAQFVQKCYDGRGNKLCYDSRKLDSRKLMNA